MSRPPARIICNTLVQAARCVICTPAGVRVEPEVYLQIRQIVGVEGGGNERGAHRVGNRVDRDHPWAARTRELAQERVHRFGGAVGGENDGRGGIGEHRVEALGVAGQLGGEQRHRDVPGLDGREKPDHIIQALRRQNRHPVPGAVTCCKRAPIALIRMLSSSQLNSTATPSSSRVKSRYR